MIYFRDNSFKNIFFKKNGRKLFLIKLILIKLTRDIKIK
jgi:hypothetical protein